MSVDPRFAVWVCLFPASSLRYNRNNLPFHEFLYASAHFRSDRVSSVMSVVQAHVWPRRKLGWNLQEAL
jgi:hypothetical protein